MLKDEHVKDILDQILSAMVEGSKNFVFWGIENSSLAVLSTLHSYGLLPSIRGLVDSYIDIQGQSFFGLEVRSPKSLCNLEFDTLIIASDLEKEAILEQFSRIDSRIPRVIFSGSTNYEFADPVYQNIQRSCSVKSKAGGYSYMLVHLYQSLKYIAQRNLPGDIAEFGVYQGGTTVFMAKVLQYYEHNSRIYGFDTFEGFPQRRSVLDIYRDKKCEFPEYEIVKRYCSSYDIELVQGDICETHTRLRDVSLALSFFDTDNYSPTKQALGLCTEQTVQGGILAFDHYYSPGWNKTIGERIAIKQTLDEKQFLNLHGTGIFIKI